MPIRKNESGTSRQVEMDLVVPGTPEEVWHALATGPGYTAWFTPTRIDERIGGTVHFDLGPMGTSTGEVTTWEPPLRFGYIEREWSPGAPPVATEVTIEARAGGRCVVRMAHSLYTASDAWDDEVEGFETGWPGFFEVLRLYLAHYAGRKAASFAVSIGVDLDPVSAWQRFATALGLAGANVGERRTAPPGAPSLAGVVAHLRQNDAQRLAVMRIDSPFDGVMLAGMHRRGDRTHPGVCVYCYGDDAEATAVAAKPAWENWLRETFAAPSG